MCYFGSKNNGLAPAEDLTYQEWRRNWLQSFPGLHSTISPGKLSAGDAWEAPLRYNLDIRTVSSVYFIMGLITGSLVTSWGPDAPNAARDGAAGDEGDEAECSFLRDSLREGRSRGKTVFIYVTHNFASACSDWSLIQQMDV